MSVAVDGGPNLDSRLPPLKRRHIVGVTNNPTGDDGWVTHGAAGTRMGNGETIGVQLGESE